jgi:hypothetical protein
VNKLLLLVCVTCLAACDDGIGPRFWIDTPDTLLLHSASRGEYIGLQSAIDLTADPVAALPIEIPGVAANWDFALVEQGGSMVLLPAAAVAGTSSRARIARLQNVNFDELLEAPRDTTLYSAVAVPLNTSSVYVIRSRRASCGFSTGYRYAKLKPVVIDAAAGKLRFAIVRNPYCDDRSFVPETE